MLEKNGRTAGQSKWSAINQIADHAGLSLLHRQCPIGCAYSRTARNRQSFLILTSFRAVEVNVDTGESVDLGDITLRPPTPSIPTQAVWTSPSH
ncbi:hypothetical protein Y032_0619g728 [Ancylostoma ceylanicum]|nr:hypothetical protein Y032_0619g728 [Ancylostoma ceylanicum]